MAMISPGTGDLGALDDVEPDAAAADDGDGVALVDVGRVERGADAGEHAAADAARRRRTAMSFGDLDRADRGDDGELGERARARHLLHRLAVARETGRAVEQAAGRHRHRARLAQVPLPVRAEVARAALRDP